MKYGFIGCGNMGGALAQALCKNRNDVLLSDRSGKGKELARRLGCQYGTVEDAAACERVFLGVKPQNMQEVLQGVQPILAEKKPLLISMAAGLTLDTVEAFAGRKLPVIRIMPNTPVAVGMGMIPYCCNSLVSPEEETDFLRDMAMAGMFDKLEEALMDGATSVAGCGPAFAYAFIDALARGGIACGLPEEKALAYAAATVAGAAGMVKATGETPQALINAVCSPGGSTIEGVKVLQQQGLEETVKACVAASYQRNRELGKK